MRKALLIGDIIKAETKKNIGEVTAGIVAIVSIFALTIALLSLTGSIKLTYDEDLDTTIGFKPMAEEKAIGFLILGCCTPLVPSAIYFFALKTKKLRTARRTYRFCWITLLISLTFVLIGVKAQYKNFEGFLINILVITFITLPFGLVIFFYRIGLRGLRQIAHRRRW